MNSEHAEIKIILVDDHRLIIQAYTSLLNEVMNFKIVGHAHNGKEATELVQKIKTDVILLDADMPVMNGYETLKFLRKTHHAAKIIILTMHTEMAFVSNYLLNGANAFLGKNCEQDELIKAINTVVTEGYYFSTTVSKSIVSRTLQNPDFKESYKSLRLTEREITILKLICEGVATDDIAQTLNISANTLKFFKKNIYRKTNTNSPLSLVKYAVKNGIIAIE